ncbi:MAG: hypothetical protein CVV49_09635 [Spirochaetae bacterium HGW-Spirochaetae-5]|nr:MAG: hypothetical protein CVV49_09635 [Spirochaetae bacterium HGW-Spirochaetae-5]
MYAFKSRVKILNDRKLVIKLPYDIPEGEAEVIILSDNKPEISTAGSNSNELINRLDEWISQIPPVPHIPLSSIDRGELYK